MWTDKARKSIFATPDSIEDKVGVGTCNIGGRGMTGYEDQKKYQFGGSTAGGDDL